MRRDDLGPRREPRRPVLRWNGVDGRAQEFALASTRPATIGRDPNNTIALDSRLVSKAHAIVEFRDGEYTIQDLASANGTKVNGEATSVRVLEPGDRIGIGDIELTFLDLAGDTPGGASAAANGLPKVVKLALAAGGTLVATLGLLFAFISSAGSPASRTPSVQQPLAEATPELIAQLRASADGSAAVKDVLRNAATANVPPAQALYEEGRLRLETERWRDAAHLLASAVARDKANTQAESAFKQAAAQLDRAASKALAAAELAEFGMRFDDALIHADHVLQFVTPPDPRYERAQAISVKARAATRANK